jgi:Linalool dehydratase/isomerase
MSVAASDPILETPLDDHYGSSPISRRLMRRAAIGYALVFALGLAPAILQAPAAYQAAGLGLLFPGGGLLAVGGWVALTLFVATLLLMLVAVALFLLTANLAAVLLVWLGAAWLAGALVGPSIEAQSPYLVCAVVLAFLAWRVTKHRKTVNLELEHRRQRNLYLPLAERQVSERASPCPEPGSRELSAEDLSHVRYALDRGLQPADSFHGFDVIEQFQTSSIRYQINNLLWALQIMQCHYTPNFHGYASQAQRNLIDKLTMPKVWKWWRWESLWGNFSLNADPIAKDNIMFGGFSSAHIALYTANTGDPRYLKPGSLSFRLNRFRTYRHDLPSILAAGRKNHEIAAYGPLYPCEPNLTYSACNLQGNFAHLVGDRIFGTDHRQRLIDQLKPLHISEMMCRDGVVHAGRVVPLGIRIPVYTSSQVEALWGWMANAFFPDLSRRIWATLREEYVSFDGKGDITIATKSYDRMDMGNYKKGEAGPYSQFLVLAREQGDDEVADAILRKLDREFERVQTNGTVSYAKTSNYAMAYLVMGRIMRTADVRHMVLKGPPDGALRGPLLAQAPYPDVLVAKAYSDGTNLSLVLHPGNGASRQTLGLERLRPGGKYRVEVEESPERDSVSSQNLTADDKGHAQFPIDLKGRTRIEITAA